MTTPAAPLDERVRRLQEGRAFVDLSHLRKVAVAGDDAAGWLNDLVTAGVAGLAAGEARRSLLLGPTGRIRADLHVVRTGDGFLLLQGPDQPRPIDALLAPYVLSSDVTLDDRSAALGLLAVLGSPPDGSGETFRPSPLEEGTGVLCPAEGMGGFLARLGAVGLEEAGADALQTWRVRRGAAWFPTDLDGESLPAEAGLERLVDFDKGCFLGQESVAKVRNLGHPTRIVVALRADGPVVAGEAVLSDGQAVGLVTSVAPDRGAAAVIARIPWEARAADLSLASGARLLPVA